MIDREKLARVIYEAVLPRGMAWENEGSSIRPRCLHAADRALELLGQPEPAPAPKPKAVQLIKAGNFLRLMDDGSVWVLLEAPARWVRCDWPEASE